LQTILIKTITKQIIQLYTNIKEGRNWHAHCAAHVNMEAWKVCQVNATD